MDAKRLEELAEWAEMEGREDGMNGHPGRARKFGDLARCAAAWAKVERELTKQAGYAIALWKHRGLAHLLTNQQSVKADTAIEAAKEEKL